MTTTNTAWEDLNLTTDTENMAAYRNHAVSASLSMSHNTVSCPAEPATATLDCSARALHYCAVDKFHHQAIFQGRRGNSSSPFFQPGEQTDSRKNGKQKNGRIHTYNRLASPFRNNLPAS